MVLAEDGVERLGGHLSTKLDFSEANWDPPKRDLGN